jgi:hypothetical protein
LGGAFLAISACDIAGLKPSRYSIAKLGAINPIKIKRESDKANAEKGAASMM